MQQRDLIKLREKRVIQRQGKVHAAKPDVTFRFALIPAFVADLAGLQRDAMFCQQRTQRVSDAFMLNVLAVPGQRQVG